MKKALVVVAPQVEEVEALAPVDLLRRAGVDCTIAACADQRQVTGRNGIVFVADMLLSEVIAELYDLVVVPGGPAVAQLRQDQRLLTLLRRCAAAGRVIAAICAAPLVLADAGLLEKRRYTGHFSIAETLPDLQDAAVVRDGQLITSRGAGTAIAFGLALVEAVCGKAAAEAVAASIHFVG